MGTWVLSQNDLANILRPLTSGLTILTAARHLRDDSNLRVSPGLFRPPSLFAVSVAQTDQSKGATGRAQPRVIARNQGQAAQEPNREQRDKSGREGPQVATGAAMALKRQARGTAPTLGVSDRPIGATS